MADTPPNGISPKGIHRRTHRRHRTAGERGMNEKSKSTEKVPDPDYA